MRRGKLKQRLLSLIMSVVMLVGMVPDLGLAALAADGEDAVVSSDTAVSEEDAVSEDAAAAEETADDEEAVSEDVEDVEEAAEPEEEEAEEEEIVDATTYDIWIGGVQVTDANKDNIPGVTNGKVSYNPASKILKFEGASGFKREGKKDGEKFYLVKCREKGVIITGDAVLETGDGEGGIWASGDRFRADLDISGTGNTGILTGGSGDDKTFFESGDINIDISGTGSYGIDARYEAVFSGANVSVKAVDVGIRYEYPVTVTGGVVNAVSTYVPANSDEYKEINAVTLFYPTMCGIAPDNSDRGEDFTVTGGTVYAEGDQWGLFNDDDIVINGGNVTGKARCRWAATGSGVKNCNGTDGKFTGIYSHNETIQISKGYAKGLSRYIPIRARKDIQLDTKVVDVIGSGENDVVEDYMNFKCIIGHIDGKDEYNATYNRYVAEVGPKSGITSYGVHVGKTEVTEVNKDNIVLEKGTATFDPATNTLTFKNAEITTPFTESDFAYYVSAGTKVDVLTVKGDLKIPAVREDGYGISAKALKIDADITIGDVDDNAVGIRAHSGDLTISGGKIDISKKAASTSGMTGIKCDNGTITINGGKLVVSGSEYAILSEQKKLNIDAMMVTNPANATVKDGTIYDGSKPATYVVMEYDTPYGFWVGNTQIKKSNYTKIPVSMGSASFDPAKNTLTFNSVNQIANKYTDSDLNKTAYIYSEREEGLIIEGSADLSGADYAVYAAEGDITLSGDFKYTANDNAVLAAKGSVNINSGKSEFKTTKEEGITAYKNVSINSAELKIDSAAAGIMALDGDIKLNNSTVSVNAAFGAGIAAGNELSITGGSVWAAGKTRAVSGAKVVFGKDTGVVYPEGAAISADETTVNGKDGKPAQTVMIGEVVTVEYDVYVGGVQVTSQNAGNVLGDGKVRYDADTATLTFDDATVSDKDDYDFIVRATNDLTINGKATLVNEEALAAIGVGGKITINADLNVKAKTAGIISLRSGIDISGGSIIAESVDTESYAIAAADIVVNGGKVTAKGKTVGIYATKNLTVSGGSIEAYADTVAVAANADGTITIDSKLEIIEPAGGKAGNATIDGENIKAIVDADGNAAKSVKIDYKGSVVKYTVSFNMMGHGAQVTSQTVVSGNKATKPADPVADDWMFVGWYTEEEYTNEFNFDTVITKDIELFAKWGQILPPGPVIKKSPLDPVEVIDDSIKALYLVKGQKFTVPAGWTVEGKDNKKLVSISKKGLLKAKKEGEAEIKNGDRVLKLYISKPAFSGKSKSYKMEAGQSYAIPLVVNENLEVLWYSAAPDVAVVSPTGNVTAIAKGSAKITAYINGSAYNYTIKVTEPTTAKTRTLHLTEGAKKTISIKGLNKVEWVSMDSEIVKVDEKNKRKITAVKSGATILKATVSEEEIYLIHVTVDNITLTGEGLAAAKGANKYDLTIKAGETAKLAFTDIYQTWVFKSSKPDIAFIDEDGNVYARSAGKAKFTAKINGKTVTVNVKVQ